MASDGAVARYGWAAQDSLFGLGGCVTLARGVTPEDALDLLVPDRATGIGSASSVRAWAEQFYEPPYGMVVEAGLKDDWTLVVEDAGGFRATLNGRAEALSRKGQAVTIYRSVNADMAFRYAEGGALVRAFDPLMFEHVPQVGEPLPEEDALGFDSMDEGYLEAMLLLTERITNVRLTPEDLQASSGHLAVGFRQ